MPSPAPTITLRPLADTDTDAVAAIWHASASLPQVGVPDMPSLAEMRARMEVELATGWDATLAVVDGAIAGFIALKPADSMVAELFIHPAYLGHGLGGALLDHAKAALPAGFTLYTRKANAPARRFYERAGMTAFREAPHPRDGAAIIFYAWTPPGG